MSRLNVAVVGCGVAARARHLPALARLRDRFEVVALCDTDSAALREASVWAAGQRTAGSIRELFAGADLFDAVLIATGGNHVAEVTAAVEAGKHVFVEKPLALTAGDARRLLAAVEAAKVACAVGYMKRYSPAVAGALRQVTDLRCVQAHLTHPPEDAYLRLVGTPRPAGGSLLEFVRGQVTDGPSAEAIRRDVGAGTNMAALVGYFLLATSVIHDVNLLRAALGGDVRVLNAALWNEGLSGQATLCGRSGRTGVLTFAFVAAGRYTETLSLTGNKTRSAVSFPSPYLSHAPIELETEDGTAGGDAVTRELFYDDVFAAELIAFHDQIVLGRGVASGPCEAVADLELIAAIARSAQVVESVITTGGNHHADLS